MQESARFFDGGGGLPSGFMVGGVPVSLHTDFRVWLEYARVMESGVPDAERAARCIEAAVDGALSPVDGETLIKGLAWFYSCGDSERLEALQVSEWVIEQRAKQPALASLYWDFWQVWASFKQQYDIDLYACGSMHWWEFMWRLEGLKSDTPFAARRTLRGIRKTEFMPEGERKSTARQKRAWSDIVTEKYFYALPGAEVVAT